MEKASYYNFKKVTKKGDLVLYNTKTGAISVVEPEEKHKALYILDNPNSDDYPNLKEQFISLGYIIDEKTNELAEIKKWHERYCNLDNLIHLTILPAEACNFKCPYCFNYKDRQIIMEDWVYESIYKFILNKISNHNDSVVRISWFGGEPLLAANKINKFMCRLKKLEKKHNTVIQASIVTNGYLLTKDLAEKMVENGIRTFQVTLDGDQENHDGLRVLKNGAPTFETIYNNLKNMRSIKKDFTFYIRGNFLKSNISMMEKLLSRFFKDFETDSRFQIYFRPVDYYETENNDYQIVSEDICDLRSGLKIQNDLAFKILSKYGYSDLRIFEPLPKPTFSWCNVERKNSFIIGADALVYICDTYVSNVDEALGKITPDGEIVLDEKAKIWRTSVFESEEIKGCLKCKILPICMAGCRKLRVNGQRVCYWTVEDILNSMERVPDLV